MSYLYWHGPQVRTEEEEPHELVGINGYEVADLSDGELAHGHVGGTQTHDLVVDLCLGRERPHIRIHVDTHQEPQYTHGSSHVYRRGHLNSHLYGPAQVDAGFDGHIVGGLEEGPLQEQGEEEQHSQHIRILQKLLGGNEIDTEQPHLEAQAGRERDDRGN